MDRISYVLDTNVIADYINQVEPTMARIRQAIHEGHDLYLCQPVRYEILRGLFKVNATRKLRAFEDQFVPQFITLSPGASDWQQAAQLWADMRNHGKQLSDMDVLIAAIAKRLNGIVCNSR